ncbi:uncharacterized protein [Aquarana catesbeiana]|uniref:uncharacterized protein n=1 Tax=Aquarana catesbeiana TaxID=8400 RepID=UPI003CC9977B
MDAPKEEETPLEEKKSESGQGAESEGQRRESGQGAESEGASDKRSGVECRERLTIFTLDQDIVVLQLLRLFSSNSDFKTGSPCPIFQVEEDTWKSEVDGSSVIVLHLSHSPGTALPDLSDVKEFLDYCREKHDPENIKVVISYVEDIHLERKITDWWNAERYRDWELLTISKTEMRSLIEHKINPLSAERKMANKLRHIHQILQEATDKKHQQSLKESAGNWLSPAAEKVKPWCRVGIFSRSAISDDSWIKELLQSDHFKDHVSDVTHYDMRDSWMCSFRILYFPKKKEQINEIDVTDVHQIQHFRSLLGKDNVIIVMDDVEDSSDQKKTRILESHPDIEDLYHNLFLFSPQEKSSEYRTLLPSLLNINKPPQPQAKEAGPVEDKRPKEMAAPEEEETPLEEKKSESGHGEESDGQRRESGQGAEPEGTSDKRSGMECRGRLTIFTRDPDTVVLQLLRLFSSNSAFKYVSLCLIVQVEEDKWKSVVDRSSVIVLHLSHSPETPLPDLSDMKEFLDYCRVKHDLKNIKVVISDVEDINLERKITDWWNAGRYRDWELLTISKTEMGSLIEHEINPLSAERRMANKLRHIYQILQEAAEKKHQRALQMAAEKYKSWFVGNWLFQSARNLLFQSAGKQRFWFAGNRKSPVPGIYKPRLEYRVGIFSRSAISDYSWIRDLLQSDYFKDHVSDVRHYDIRDSWMCSFGILYFTKKKEQINEIDVTDVQQIQRYRSLLGKDNVIIVMDDVEDSSDQKKTQILESHPDIKDLYHNLFLFSPQEKSSEYRTLLLSLLNINKPPQPQAEKAGPIEGAPGNDDIVTTDGTPKKDKTPEGAPGNDDIVTTDGAPNKDKTPEASFKGNMDMIRKIMESTRPINLFLRKSHTVGIFSRSSESDYEWLIKQLKSEPFCYIVSTANPHYISNNGMRKFRDDVSRCTFGILYHTRNRGRIRIVDVTDSLYDEEINYMSQHLGKWNVIVVVDDLEDTSDVEKRRILESQPSIGKSATGLFLFNANHKKSL